jgi:hypothetical protein
MLDFSVLSCIFVKFNFPHNFCVFSPDLGCLVLRANAVYQGVTKRCRLSWLTNSAHVYEPKCGGRKGGGVAGRLPYLRGFCWSGKAIL